MFENSPDETKTQTEKDFNLGFVKQIGDIGLIVRWILFAVFFTLLLVVGNTMAQSVRERIPELAVLKTLGFSDGSGARLRVRRGARAVPVRRPDRVWCWRRSPGAMVEKGIWRPVPAQRSMCRCGCIGVAADRHHEHRRRAAAGAARAAPEDRRCTGGALSAAAKETPSC